MSKSNYDETQPQNWSYRILKRKGRTTPGVPTETYYALHEVHFNRDDSDSPHSWTEEPARFIADEQEGKDGVIKALEMALRNAQRYPVFEEPEDDLDRPPLPSKN